MTLEAGKEMDRRCVLNWLNEVYVTPSRAFNEYTEDELKMFAHDALVLLKEQLEVIRCKDCKHRFNGCCYDRKSDRINFGVYVADDWFCADGERR